MTHDATKNYFDKFIRPVDDAYLSSTVYGKFKGVTENDFILIERDLRICRYKVHHIQYFTPHSEEFIGELLWVGYELK